MKQKNESDTQDNLVAEDNNQLLFASAVTMFETAITDEEVNEALKQIYELAENNNPKAQNFMGWLYYEGERVQQDYKKAFTLFSKSAQSQYTDALFMLGVMYNKGQGINKDEARGFHYFKLAADKGDEYALFNIGIHYYNGYGIKKRLTKSI